MVSGTPQATDNMEQVREKNVSGRKLEIVRSASFDTVIAAITAKTENAQCTFMHRLFQTMDGQVLATAYLYAEKEIKRRATNVVPAKAA